MTRLIVPSLALILTGCSASDMDYFWNGPQDGSTYTPVYQSTSDDWLERTRQSGEKARYEYDMKAAEQGRRQIESVSATIREWPLLSVAVAFAAGCVISRLLRR